MGSSAAEKKKNDAEGRKKKQEVAAEKEAHANSQDEDDGAEEEKEATYMPDVWDKAAHLLCLTWWLLSHCALLRFNCTAGGAWSLLMIVIEIAVLAMHAVGLNKAALLISIGETAGTHFQRFFLDGHPTLLAGVASTFPLMNLHLLSASLAYVSAPWTDPSHKPSFENWLMALILGAAINVLIYVCWTWGTLDLCPLLPALYMLPGPGQFLRRKTIDFLSAE
uniref:Uncharacterized protein n=1 Tax=Alexandrium catenella TaxID=2925 RepID=A0A7S1MC94_ALECA